MTKLIWAENFFDFSRSRLIDCTIDDSMFEAFDNSMISKSFWSIKMNEIWSIKFFDFFFYRLKANCALFFLRHLIDDTIWWWWFWIVLIFEKILWWLFHFSNRKICMIFFMHLFNFRCFYEKSKFLNSTKNFVLKLLTIRFEYWMHFWFDVMRCVFWFHSLFFS